MGELHDEKTGSRVGESFESVHVCGFSGTVCKIVRPLGHAGQVFLPGIGSIFQGLSSDPGLIEGSPADSRSNDFTVERQCGPAAGKTSRRQVAKLEAGVPRS